MDELTPDQKKFIDDNWNKLKIIDLIRQTFNDPEIDARHKKSKLVREYLGDRKPIPSNYQKMESIDLNEDQKEFIHNNAKHLSATEIARVVFNDVKLGPLNLESRTVLAYIKTLPVEVTGKNFNDEITEEYRPPNTLKQITQKINECLLMNFDDTQLNKYQIKTFETLGNFMKSPRYLQMINSYSSVQSRKIFESEFVRTTFHKPDLTPDELNLCINLCFHYVLMITVNRQLDMLSERYELVVGNPEASISQSLAEMIKAKTKELNDCDIRQQKLINDLEVSRSVRQKNKSNSDLTVAKLIEWWSDEEQRRSALERAEKRKQIVNEELDNLIDMEDIQARILGFTRSELING